MTAREPARWRARVACAAIVLGGHACGDSSPVDEVVTAMSGDRLKTMWLGYDDGTRQAHPGQLYDLGEGTVCAPGRMLDGALRCVPLAEDAVFIDRDCTRVVGRARAIARPSHFIVHERIAGVRLPARVFRAGANAAPTRVFYERRDGACFGPFTADADHVAHAVTAEVDVGSLAALAAEELGAGRLGLTVFTTADGLRWPTTLRDRELDVPCAPALEADGAVRCHPADVPVASVFTDPSCREPAFQQPAAAPVPRVAETVDGDGCARYVRVGAAIAGPPYHREGDQCRRLPLDPSTTAYETGAEIPLVELARTIEHEPGRRLQHIVLADGALRFHDDRLHDSAIHDDCRPAPVGESTRCVPETLASGTTLYSSTSCLVAVPVAALPQPTCRRPRFARVPTDASPFGELHAIGDPVFDPLYQSTFPFPPLCRPYVAPAVGLLHALGPALEPTLFPGAILFGER